MKSIKKIILTAQDKVKEMELYVNKVLDALDHPEALVTDESQIYHFLCFFDEQEKKSELRMAEEFLGLKLNESDLVVDVAERLRQGENEQDEQED